MGDSAQQLYATGSWSDANTSNESGDVTWSSDNDPVATISSGGLVSFNDTNNGGNVTVTANSSRSGASVADTRTFAVEYINASDIDFVIFGGDQVNDPASREQFDAFMCLPESSGRKLEFLTHEMYRETNTIGSKGSDTAIAHLVVDLKTELERIREQVQNVE